jgi:hypothetical protein
MALPIWSWGLMVHPPADDLKQVQRACIWAALAGSR